MGVGRRVVIPVVMALQLGACRSWAPVTVDLANLLETNRPGVVRLTRKDSTQLVVENPRIVRDSVGVLVRDCFVDSASGRAACTMAPAILQGVIAVDDVSLTEVRQINPSATGLTIMLAGILVGYGVLYCCFSGGP